MKVRFAYLTKKPDEVFQSTHPHGVRQLLQQNGVKIGQNRLFEWMRKHGYLCTRGEYKNQPTQKSMEMGLFELKKTTITKPDGTVLVSNTTKVTGRGQIYFINKFLNDEAGKVA